MDAHCAMLLSLWAVDTSTGFAPHRYPQELLENMRSVPAIAGHDARNSRDLRREKAEAHNLQPVAGMVRNFLTQRPSRLEAAIPSPGIGCRYGPF
jgi:hypothetical protein